MTREQLVNQKVVSIESQLVNLNVMSIESQLVNLKVVSIESYILYDTDFTVIINDCAIAKSREVSCL